MKITSYVDLTLAQENALQDFQSVVVRTALIEPCIVATFKTFQDQQVKVTINEYGLIKGVEFVGTP